MAAAWFKCELLRNPKLTLTDLITWEFSQVASLRRPGVQTRIEARLFSLLQFTGYSLLFFRYLPGEDRVLLLN